MTINVYPDIVRQEDLSPDEGFGAEIDDDCEGIRAATKGWGSDAQKVIDLLACKDPTDRFKLALRYKELMDKDLAELCKKEFSGDFGWCMQFLAMPPHEAECAMLKKATDGIGASANVIYSIMCGRTNEEMELLKKTYFRLYTKDLGKLMASELHGNMERIVFNCMQAGEEAYDPQYHTNDKATEDAEAIYKSGQARWGTDEKAIFKLLCASPSEHVENINKIYADKYGYSLMKALEKELSGNVRDASLHMIGMKLKPYEACANLIKSACAGIGTDELLLTCALVRYQGIMGEVMTAHIELFGKSVHDRVRSETGGKYKEALLATLNAVWPEEG